VLLLVLASQLDDAAAASFVARLPVMSRAAAAVTARAGRGTRGLIGERSRFRLRAPNSCSDGNGSQTVACQFGGHRPRSTPAPCPSDRAVATTVTCRSRRSDIDVLDDSDKVGAAAGPPGSAQIEKTFEGFFTSRGLPFKGTDFSGRSDYGPFIAKGIPSGGLFTGAEGIKTAQEAAIFGGTAGVAYDPCYHQACDPYANNNDVALDNNSDAIAYSVISYAMSTEPINGTKSKGNFKPPADPAAPLAA
jgi:hypothetical protein